jgi:hypothetical protein
MCHSDLHVKFASRVQEVEMEDYAFIHSYFYSLDFVPSSFFFSSTSGDWGDKCH